jgi:hypothetical protein
VVQVIGRDRLVIQESSDNVSPSGPGRIGDPVTLSRARDWAPRVGLSSGNESIPGDSFFCGCLLALAESTLQTMGCTNVDEPDVVAR